MRDDVGAHSFPMTVTDLLLHCDLLPWSGVILNWYSVYHNPMYDSVYHVSAFTNVVVVYREIIIRGMRISFCLRVSISTILESVAPAHKNTTVRST